jgi:hypothetical protein
VVERIFGILKRRFRILALPPEYSMDIQARIPPALCALHNFIRHFEPTEIDDYPPDVAADLIGAGHVEIEDLATEAVNSAQRNRMSLERDRIAQEMWDSYMALVQEGEAGLEAAPPG